MSQTAPPTSAQKRLMKDYAEVLRDPLPTICARPCPNNLLVWYANILAPEGSKYHGIVLHVQIKFDESYPHSPPKATLLSPLRHSHVFEGFICLDMLNTHHSLEPYSGWSSAYSVQSLLSQLQSFLLEEEYVQSVESIQQDIRNSLSLVHRDTKNGKEHDMPAGKPWPWTDDWPSLSKESSGKPPLDHGTIVPCTCKFDVSKDIALEICEFLLPQQLKVIQYVSKSFFEAANSPQVWISREIICFHSKQTWKEDVIGIGLNYEFNNSDMLIHVDSPVDLLSYTSFNEEEVRKSVWNQDFYTWMPLFVNEEHALRAIPLFEMAVDYIYGTGYTPKLIINPHPADSHCLSFIHSRTKSGFSPAQAAHLLCVFMNSMIVRIMNGSIHASTKALEGYCYAHRWLIYLCQTYPDLLATINSTVRHFLSNSKARLKSNCPDIGMFIAMLSVSDYSWHHVKQYIVEETLNRQALWIQKSFPELGTVKSNKYDIHERSRIANSFTQSQIGLKLLMFNVYFLTRVVSNDSDSSEATMPPQKKDLPEMSRIYNMYFGTATEQQKKDLQETIFDIQQLASYDQFFKYVHMGHELQVYEQLCKSMRYSEQVGYHKPKKYNKRSGNHDHDRRDNKRRR